MVLAAFSPSLAVGKVKFFGKSLRPDVQNNVTTAQITMSTEEVTHLDISLSDPEWTHLASGIFKPGNPVDYEDLHMIVDSLDTEDTGGQEGITVACRPRVVQRLKKRRGRKVMRKTSPSSFVINECRAVGAKYVVQPSGRRKQVARDVKEKKQTYDEDSTPSSWTTFDRLAGEIGFICFEYAQVVYFGKPTWLLARAKRTAAPVYWQTGDQAYWSETIPECSRTYDNKEGVTVDVTMPSERAHEFKPGYAIILRGVPTFTGYYLITNVSYDLAGLTGRVQVTAKSAINPEKSK